MQRKTIPLAGIKTAGLAEGEFEGYASVFDNVDAHGDVVRRGAFKSLDADRVVPLIWMHKADDPTAYVGEVVEAHETAEGLAIKGRFDLDTEPGSAAYKQVKGRRVSGLSIGFYTRKERKSAEGNELLDVDLVEISLVNRGANPDALVASVKSRPTTATKSWLARRDADLYLKESSMTATGTSAQMTMLTKGRDEQLALVKSIIDTADELGRDLTADEAAQVSDATAKVKRIDAAIAQKQHDDKVTADTHAWAKGIGAAPGSEDDRGATASTGFLQFGGSAAKKSARVIVDAMAPADAYGRKALVSAGQTITSVPMDPEPNEMGRPLTSLVEALNSKVRPREYSYLRQSVRTNSAAPVAEGALKPESAYKLDTIDGKLRVIAHISDPVDTYALRDAVNLEEFVHLEMMYGVQVALESQILNGNGTAPNMQGLLGMSGVQVQTFSTDILTSVRKAITRLETTGVAPGLLVLTAADLEAIELLAVTSGATDVRGVPLDAAARRLFGVPVVVSNAMPAGNALLMETSAVSIDHDGEIDAKWSDAADEDFQRNQTRCRVEGRFGLSVYRPAGIVKIATA